jgi:hypothetical protein
MSVTDAADAPLGADTVYLNGINALTGEYLVPPTPVAEIANLVKSQPDDPQTRVLSRMGEMASQVTLGLPPDRDPKDLKQAGWAIVFHASEKQEIKEAFRPLIEHRQAEIGDDRLVKVLDYRNGEGRAQWLARFRVAAGDVDPLKVPYYLLFVGSPAQIPFTFGFLLDVEYAVGHVAFESVEECATYANNIVDYERKKTSVKNGREVLFFATRHPLDGATRLSADQLVLPLADGLPSGAIAPQSTPAKYGFRSRKIWGKDATKAALVAALCAKNTTPPAVLFSASHGMAGWPAGDPAQLASQGALLCQDWPGLGKIRPDHYFAASDLPGDAQVHGLIAFLFACYSIGTPQYDRYFHKRSAPPPVIASSPFYAQLPQKLLTHKNGGALACVGHVERAWGCSIVSTGAVPQLGPFQNALGFIMQGVPLGHAIQDFNQKFAILSADLTALLEDIGFGAKVSDTDLATRWLERNDAEGYAIFGDPAVRLRLEDLV